MKVVNYIYNQNGVRELVIPMIIDFVKKHKHWTISLQSHKYEHSLNDEAITFYITANINFFAD